MAQEYAKDFYLSTTWRAVSNAYRVNKVYTCEECRAYGYVVHHIKYITPQNIDDPDVTLNENNLMLLCNECHNRIHHRRSGGSVADGYRFTADGDLACR